MISQGPVIKSVTPSIGVPGGEVTVYCCGFCPGLPDRSRVRVGDVEAAIVTASEDKVVVRLPDSPNALGICLEADGQTSPVFPISMAARLADGLHPVGNPVITRDGSIITTISGSRGQQVAQPVVRVTSSGEKVGYSCDILNPTGLAVGGDGQLYITSRQDGCVLRFTDLEQMEVVAEGLGVACGIAFDSKGNLFVGDRGGTVYRVDRSGGKEEYAALEPSVSAFHLALDADDRLYVTGPTLAMRDPLYRIPSRGRVEVVMRGFARPQGMSFLPDGDLLIAAAYGGRKGVFRLNPDSGTLVHYISAPMLVGLAVSDDTIVVADSESLYRIHRSGGAGRVI